MPSSITPISTNCSPPPTPKPTPLLDPKGLPVVSGYEIIEALGKNRIIADPMEVVRRAPDIVLGSWCGKKFRPERVMSRPGFDRTPAVQHQDLYEIKSPLILQPGPAALTDGLAELQKIVWQWAGMT